MFEFTKMIVKLVKTNVNTVVKYTIEHFPVYRTCPALTKEVLSNEQTS